ncbi:phage tail protein [Azospirillum brasilense]|uniref:phage tail tube protein n=1 Tax=Azospirillum argentinense TaxID=2970906 RepID=UPI00190D48F6|nr:phage tail tube protein [Azospirillum argentinense]MBK3797872.1 phage tail protein [Azospirillum argentinense]
MSKKVAGVCYLKVDGTQYALRGSLTVSPDDIEREGIAGQDGVHGFKESSRVPFISADLSDTDGLSLEALRAITDATVTAELATGKVYVLRNAWTKAGHELDTAEGQVSVVFQGMKCEESR